VTQHNFGTDQTIQGFVESKDFFAPPKKSPSEGLECSQLRVSGSSPACPSRCRRLRQCENGQCPSDRRDDQPKRAKPFYHGANPASIGKHVLKPDLLSKGIGNGFPRRYASIFGGSIWQNSTSTVR
jgi:hypothetical protein